VKLYVVSFLVVRSNDHCVILLCFLSLFSVGRNQVQVLIATSGVGLLHSIVFQRALGAFKPVDAYSELFDIAYVRNSNVLSGNM
jgi:hypothetical protein